MYRVEAVGQKNFQLYFKTIFVNMWNLGQFHENWNFVKNSLIKVRI